MMNCASALPANFDQLVSRVAGIQIPDEKTITAFREKLETLSII